jgi:Uma2 family endonuclease
MSAQPHSRLSEEEYLKFERAAELRHEYYDGQIYAMSGAWFLHARIISNLTFAIRGQLPGRGCDVLTNDVRVRMSPSRFYTYPDIVVVCVPPIFADDQKDTILNPTLLIEVLSPSTEKHDRGFKLNHYREIESLLEYAIVSQSEPRIELFRRRGAVEWLYSDAAGLASKCNFESLDVSVPLAEIYGRVEFPPEPASPEPES